MPDIEMLNILIINCSTIGTQETEPPNAVQTQQTARVQDVSNIIQTQDRKLADQKGGKQTQAAVQI